MKNKVYQLCQKTRFINRVIEREKKRKSKGGGNPLYRYRSRLILGWILALIWFYGGEPHGVLQAQDSSRTIFVDHLLDEADLIGGIYTETYSIADRNHQGSDGLAYKTANEAAQVLQPGDTLLFRAGTYRNTYSGRQADPVMRVLASGTAQTPITIRNYNNEMAIITAVNADGQPRHTNAIALGREPSSQQDVSGQGVSYITIEGLIIEGAVGVGLGIFGPADKYGIPAEPSRHITVRRVIARNNRGHNAAGRGIQSKGRVENVLIEYCEAYDNTGGGIGLGRIDKHWHEPEPLDQMSAAHHSVIRHCLMYNNIHPDYPGNTDGTGGSHMYRCTLEGNITWGNSDDGFDIYASIECLIKDNISFGHSYEGGNNSGLKFAAGGGGGHLVIGNIIFNNDGVSLEGSIPSNRLRPYFPSRVINNIACRGLAGLSLGHSYDDYPVLPKTLACNNISFGNTNTDYFGTYQEWLDSDYNFIGDEDRLRRLKNAGFDLNSLTGDHGLVNPDVTIDTNFSPDWTIEQKLAHIRGQVQAAFNLGSDSQLIDAGAFIAGVHNPLPDESGPLRVWRSTAPDIGAYEYLPGGSSTQIITLNSSWNWISFNVLPGDRSLDAVFGGILGQVEQVRTQNQSAMRVGGNWIGDLGNMDGIQAGRMYKLRVSANCSLTVTGTPIAAATPISLTNGWNWAAYSPSSTLAIGSALSSITGQVQQARSQNQSAIYNAGSWLGDLSQMAPGRGYTIRVSGPVNLIYQEE